MAEKTGLTILQKRDLLSVVYYTERYYRDEIEKRGPEYYEQYRNHIQGWRRYPSRNALLRNLDMPPWNPRELVHYTAMWPELEAAVADLEEVTG